MAKGNLTAKDLLDLVQDETFTRDTGGSGWGKKNLLLQAPSEKAHIAKKKKKPKELWDEPEIHQDTQVFKDQ